MNNLVLAYLGDAVYELYIREYLISKGFVKVNDLQNESLKYVSASSQSNHLKRLMDNNFLTEDEIDIVKRGRNMSSHNKKNTDIVTYKITFPFHTAAAAVSVPPVYPAGYGQPTFAYRAVRFSALPVPSYLSSFLFRWPLPLLPTSHSPPAGH